jgi:hypothetical protein
VTLISVKRHGAVGVELVYQDASGRLGSELLYSEDMAQLEITPAGLPWSFDGDGALFRLTSEAYRIDLFLSEFVKTHTPDRYPKEIIIVGNNSQPTITVPLHYDGSELHIVLLNCTSIGPACARNCGAQHAQGDWILFTDSDCIPSQSFMQGYFSALNGSVGYAGYVKAWGNDFISQYYESQEILLTFT